MFLQNTVRFQKITINIIHLVKQFIYFCDWQFSIIADDFSLKQNSR